MQHGELQETLLAILEEIDRICQAESISYFLYAGTLLGAMRHQGFIPWDDDIDVMMSRDEFERFCDRFPSSSEFELFTHRARRTFPYASAKVSRTGTLVVEEVDIAPDDRFGVSVDVFPFDSISDNSLLYRAHVGVMWVVRAILLLKVVQPASDRPYFQRALLRMTRPALRWVSVETLTDARDAVARLWRYRRSESVAMLVAGRPWRVSRAVIEPGTTLAFEGRRFPSPSNPSALLATQYGDYMKLPPAHKRRPPHRSVAYRIERDGEHHEP